MTPFDEELMDEVLGDIDRHNADGCDSPDCQACNGLRLEFTVNGEPINGIPVFSLPDDNAREKCWSECIGLRGYGENRKRSVSLAGLDLEEIRLNNECFNLLTGRIRVHTDGHV